MNQHVTEWIPAYLDGEICGTRLNQVKEHLRGCSICCLELEKLRKLSILLKNCPPMTARSSRSQFAAQVGLKLPRSMPVQTYSSRQKFVNIGWLAIPISIILGWSLSQIALLIITGIKGLGVNSPWLAGVSLLQRFNGYTHWNLINPVLWDSLIGSTPWIGLVETLTDTFAPYLVITLVTAIFLWCWMVCWWILHQRKI